MSSPTRRSVLGTAALIAGAAVLPKAIEAKVSDALSQKCPACSADLDIGELHKAGCEAANVMPPHDSEIKPEATKIRERTYAQEPSGCGSRGYDLKKPPVREEPGCGSRGYDLKKPLVREEPSGCGSRGSDTKGGQPGCRSRG
jgi:hypothetical protein